MFSRFAFSKIRMMSGRNTVSRWLAGLGLGASAAFAGAAVAQAVPLPGQAAETPGGGAVPAAYLDSAALAELSAAGGDAGPFLSDEADEASFVKDPDAIRVLLSPDIETTLVAMMAGRISSLPVQLGAALREGDLVAGIACDEPEARLHMAKAELTAANSTLGVKSRLRKLDAAGDIEVSLAAAEADKARAALEMARTQAGYCNVLAPFDGRIVRVLVKPHQGVGAGTALVEMISDGPLKLRLNIPSRWLAHVGPGTPFQISVNETGLAYPARVTHVNARVDAVAQTIELEARMDNAEPDLLAGMSGIARFGRIP